MQAAAWRRLEETASIVTDGEHMAHEEGGASEEKQKEVTRKADGCEGSGRGEGAGRIRMKRRRRRRGRDVCRGRGGVRPLGAAEH